MAEDSRARLVGINHVALEVGDIDAALDWYGQLFEFELRRRSSTGAFIDIGDQFIALSETDTASGSPDRVRHFGLVVDDLQAVRNRIEESDIEPISAREKDIRDPWGNRLQLVEYAEVQFTKVDHVLDEMAVEADGLQKTASALAELDEKGMAPE